jgi:hypothetical protein
MMKLRTVGALLAATLLGACSQAADTPTEVAMPDAVAASSAFGSTYAQKRRESPWTPRLFKSETCAGVKYEGTVEMRVVSFTDEVNNATVYEVNQRGTVVTETGIKLNLRDEVYARNPATIPTAENPGPFRWQTTNVFRLTGPKVNEIGLYKSDVLVMYDPNPESEGIIVKPYPGEIVNRSSCF